MTPFWLESCLAGFWIGLAKSKTYGDWGCALVIVVQAKSFLSTCFALATRLSPFNLAEVVGLPPALCTVGEKRLI